MDVIAKKTCKPSVFLLGIWIWGFVFLGFGCVKQKAVDDNPPADDWKTFVQEPVESTIPQPDSPPSDLPPARMPTEIPARKAADLQEKIGESDDSSQKEKKLPNEKIYMDMKDVDLSILLRTLAKIADQSIMISENVRGTATVSVKKQPWDKVFLSLLRTYGLSYEWEGDIIRILTLEDINNEFRRLDVNQRREAKKREIEAVAPLVSEVVKVDYTDAKKLREVFDQFLSGGDRRDRRGSVMVDDHTNSLVIQGTRDEIEIVRRLVEELDRPTPQVRIEARIVEATGDTARELGIEWGGMYLQKRGTSRYWITPGSNTPENEGTQDIFPPVGDQGEDQFVPSPGLIQNLPTIISEGAGLNIGFMLQDLGNILSIQLSALQRKGKLNILSSPSISTLDNQTAVIESGREVPYQTVESDEVNIEFKKAVLRLEVTPHVIEDNLLRMNIISTKDELDFSNQVAGNPTVITKKAETVVLLRDGQTTVIGGLRKETNSDTEIGIPILMDIPLLGHLFKRKSHSNDMEEILIFITPHILESPRLERVP